MKYNERIEIRLDPEHARKVAELREVYHATTSDVVRKAIDAEYENAALAKRLKAVEELAAMEIEVVPDIETIKRQSGRYNDVDPDLP